MNLIDESFKSKEEIKKRKTTTIIMVAIIFVIISIMAIGGYLAYYENSRLKFYLNNQINTQISELIVNENGTLYFPIKEVSKYLDYESYNGEYKDKSEERSKCYIQSENEIANFYLGSNKIYKLDLNKNNGNYEYVYIKKPVKAIKGELYITEEGLEKAFNVSFEYDQEKNKMYLLTLPYLVDYFQSMVLDNGYTEMSNVFANQKAIMQDKIVVMKDNKHYGVISTNGNVILEPKYDNITYLSQVGDFLVEVDKKVGIISPSKETKVQIIYDNIELMDSDAGLYVAKKENKYGILDLKGNIKLYIENDEIGIDAQRYEKNNIKSKYILAEKLIPVRKDKLWGLFDTNGNQIVDFKYDSIGYIATDNKNAFNLIVIPEYNVIVAGVNKKYTLINTDGKELIRTVADDIYMTISGGEKHYYINANDRNYDAESYLKSIGVNAKIKNADENIVKKDETKQEVKEENVDSQEESENNDLPEEESENNNSSDEEETNNDDENE